MAQLFCGVASSCVGGCTALPMSALALGLQPCAVKAAAHSHCWVADLSVGGNLGTELKDHICDQATKTQQPCG
jgi:hypothetical protein